MISLVQRYIPPDPLDPRAVIQDALKKVPPVSATTWEVLHHELSVLQEFFSRQDPPKYKEAQLAEKAAKYALDFENQELPPQTGLKWIGEGLRARQRHRAYLNMVQVMVQYSFTLHNCQLINYSKSVILHFLYIFCSVWS